MRVARHAGKPTDARMLWTDVPVASRRQVELAEGEDLFTTLHRLLDDEGAAGATFSLLAGHLASLTIMTGGPGGDTPMTFHGPFAIVTPATVLGGSGITGVDESGGRTSHCHAAFCDARGKSVGGHLTLGGTVAGAGGLWIELTSLSGAAFVRRLDAETGFVIFHPEAA